MGMRIVQNVPEIESANGLFAKDIKIKYKGMNAVSPNNGITVYEFPVDDPDRAWQAVMDLPSTIHMRKGKTMKLELKTGEDRQIGAVYEGSPTNPMFSYPRPARFEITDLKIGINNKELSLSVESYNADDPPETWKFELKKSNGGAWIISLTEAKTPSACEYLTFGILSPVWLPLLVVFSPLVYLEVTAGKSKEKPRLFLLYSHLHDYDPSKPPITE